MHRIKGTIADIERNELEQSINESAEAFRLKYGCMLFFHPLDNNERVKLGIVIENSKLGELHQSCPATEDKP